MNENLLNVVTKNLGLPLRELENYNGKVEDEMYETIPEKTDREINDLDATSISIVSPKNTITFGEELIMTVEPTPFTSNPPVCVWETSDSEIAYINELGVIIGGKKSGSVTITATDTDFNNLGQISATKTITVTNPSLKFTINPSEFKDILAAGETKTFTIEKPATTTLVITKDEVATEMIDGSSSLSDGSIIIKANTANEPRTGIITFSGEGENTATLTITQLAASAED